MPSTSNINDTFTDQSHPLLNMSSHKSLNLSNILFNYDDELEAMLVENLERKQSPRPMEKEYVSEPRMKVNKSAKPKKVKKSKSRDPK